MVEDLSPPSSSSLILLLKFFKIFFSADFLLWTPWQLLGRHLNFANVKEFKRHRLFRAGHKSEFCYGPALLRLNMCRQIRACRKERLREKKHR